MRDLRIFNYQDTSVRTVVIDGEPWFVASDVAKILGYREAYDMTRRLDDDDKGPHSLRTPGGDQNMTVISEAGLYVAVLGSQVPGAKDFKRWITHEVLPTIRKTGSYGTPALTEDQIVAQALQITKAKADQLEAKVAEDAPKVDYVDTFVGDDDKLLFRTVASDLNIGEAELRRVLIERGWIYAETSRRYSESKGKVVPQYRYSEYSAKKPYFHRSMNHDAPRFKGEVNWTLKITPAGAATIARLLGRINGGGEAA